MRIAIAYIKKTKTGCRWINCVKNEIDKSSVFFLLTYGRRPVAMTANKLG